MAMRVAKERSSDARSIFWAVSFFTLGLGEVKAVR